VKSCREGEKIAQLAERLEHLEFLELRGAGIVIAVG